MNLLREIADVSKRAYDKNLVAATDGNFSARGANGAFFITRSGLCKGDATIRDVIEIDAEGKVVRGSGKASSESKLHLFLYKRREDARAVAHCHPPYATAFSMAKESLDRPTLPEVATTIGRIPVCAYAAPSTEELATACEPYVEFGNAFLLENHGAVTIGGNVREAYFRMEKLEHAAKTLFIAKNLGGARELTREELDRLYRVAEESYGARLHPRNKY
ncbi:MAG: class II aldolase/adducin family protein [Ignavibacteriales bacterium]|nr:class II aldolase/adducin family protein [Ignavibacteriales bacterium]